LNRHVPVTEQAALHVIDTGGPGGAETVFCQLAHQLNNKPLRAVTVVPYDGWLASQLRSIGLEPRLMASRGSLNFAFLSHLLDLVRRENVKLIYAHLLGACVYGAIVGLLLRIPVIGIFHGPTDVLKPGRFAMLKRWFLGRKDVHCVAVSESTKEALVDFGIAANRITLIPNGIDIEAFHATKGTHIRDELGLSPHDELVGAVGNIRVPKAYDLLLNAAALVLKEFPNVHFAVVGGGSDDDLAPLLTLRESLGLTARFHFLGFRKTTPEVYGNFDLFVSSSRSEGLPLSLLEAMASQLCVVATESGGAQEVVDSNSSGILVPVENALALAMALKQVLADRELRRQLATAGATLVGQRYSLKSAVTRYQKLSLRLTGGTDQSAEM
jgi:glycosyltransferase involved in cell wall biosynthesis